MYFRIHHKGEYMKKHIALITSSSNKTIVFYYISHAEAVEKATAMCALGYHAFVGHLTERLSLPSKPKPEVMRL